MNSEKYIGLDVHQATISVAVLDSTGKLVMESILETKATTILQFFAGLRGRHVLRWIRRRDSGQELAPFRGPRYDRDLAGLGWPEWLGPHIESQSGFSRPVVRPVAFVAILAQYRPHIVVEIRAEL